MKRLTVVLLGLAIGISGLTLGCKKEADTAKPKPTPTKPATAPGK